MKGIIRRIDELGRIVIPKEIRKSLKIRNNDLLDISIDDFKIVLHKYSNFYDINSFLDIVVSFLGSSIDKDIIIFDRNKIISEYKCLFDNLLGKEIDDKLIELLNIRKNNYEIVGNMEINKKVYSGKFLYSSIIPNGDVMGGILIYSVDNYFDEFDKYVLDLLTKTLTKYIED